MDTKNEVLASDYGRPSDFTLANTVTALGTSDLDASGSSFTAIPNQAAFINTAVLLLLGSGLVGVGAFIGVLRVLN